VPMYAERKRNFGRSPPSSPAAFIGRPSARRGTEWSSPVPTLDGNTRSPSAEIANPFGPPVRGWKDVAATMERASSLWSEGEVAGFENVTTYATADLGYIVEVERFKARIGGSADAAPVALRTTSILRRENGAWKILHRHADPIITTAQPAQSVIQD
jgi:ketosteroid isomerase-like protein